MVYHCGDDYTQCGEVAAAATPTQHSFDYLHVNGASVVVSDDGFALFVRGSRATRAAIQCVCVACYCVNCLYQFRELRCPICMAYTPLWPLLFYFHMRHNHPRELISPSHIPCHQHWVNMLGVCMHTTSPYHTCIGHPRGEHGPGTMSSC